MEGNERRDLAKLKIVSMVDGRVLKESVQPLAVGRSAGLRPGEEMTVLGYPGIGLGTISVTTGHVTGFLFHPATNAVEYVKTDARIAPGHSGGAAIDKRGELVGIPVAGQADRSGLPVMEGLVIPSDDLTQIPWDRMSGPERDPPANTGGASKKGDEGQQAASGVRLRGQILDADTGAPLPNALILFLKPGVDPKAWEGDTKQVVTAGKTGDTGEYVTAPPVPRGHAYGVIVGAKGYELLRVVFETKPDHADVLQIKPIKLRKAR